MKLYYFKSHKGNFGDDLNPWLWPQIFNNFEDLSNEYFFGIGSILDADNPSFSKIRNSKKIVFGTGIRPSLSYKNFKTDRNWDIKFLRGPLSANHLGFKSKYISDAAYAVRQVNDFVKIKNSSKKYKVSLMPYFHSVHLFNWKEICDSLGYHYISPLSENGVEFTLSEIAQSECLISEAMHGAILADALRVPWHKFILSTPFTEGERISSFKWEDWLRSIDIYKMETSYVHCYSEKNIINNISIRYLFKTRVKDRLLSRLAEPLDFILSDEKVISDIDSKMNEEIQKLRNI